LYRAYPYVVFEYIPVDPQQPLGRLIQSLQASNTNGRGQTFLIEYQSKRARAVYLFVGQQKLTKRWPSRPRK